MTDRDLALLRALDPAPAARTEGTARSAWGEATLGRILDGAVAAPRRGRLRPLLAGAAGLAALAALFVVLLVATRGPDAAPVATTQTVVTAPGPGVDLDDVAATIRRRAELLGAEDVTVTREGTRLVVAQPVGERRIPLGRGTLTAGLVPVGGVPVDQKAWTLGIRTARVGERDVVEVDLTEAGAAALADVTRQAVTTAQLAGREDGRFALLLDNEVLTRPTISVADYPNGIASGSLQLISDRPAREVAAVLSTPLPALEVRTDEARTPAETVEGFLAAVDAGGGAAAERYVTPGFAARDAGADDSWLDGRPVRNVTVTSVTGAGFTSYGPHAQAMQVMVDFDLPGGGGGFRDGRNTWGFVVVRDAPGDPWLISDQGLG